MRLITFITAALVLLLASPTNAETLTAKKTVAPEAFVLSDDVTVRLVGINAPPNPALAKKAEELLNRLIAGKTIVLDNRGKDRHGRTFADVYTVENGGKSWLQGELIKSGYYFVYPMLEAEDNTQKLLKLESAARAEKRGMWAENDYRDIAAEKVESSYGKYSFVVGTVLDAANRGDKTFLNFGKDWHTDFSVTVGNRLKSRLKRFGIKLDEIKGKKVRVRGLIEDQNGPMIILYDPGQLELLP